MRFWYTFKEHRNFSLEIWGAALSYLHDGESIAWHTALLQSIVFPLLPSPSCWTSPRELTMAAAEETQKAEQSFCDGELNFFFYVFCLLVCFFVNYELTIKVLWYFLHRSVIFILISFHISIYLIWNYICLAFCAHFHCTDKFSQTQSAFFPPLKRPTDKKLSNQ